MLERVLDGHDEQFSWTKPETVMGTDASWTQLPLEQQSQRQLDSGWPDDQFPWTEDSSPGLTSFRLRSKMSFRGTDRFRWRVARTRREYCHGIAQASMAAILQIPQAMPAF